MLLREGLEWQTLNRVKDQREYLCQWGPWDAAGLRICRLCKGALLLDLQRFIQSELFVPANTQ